MKRFLTSIVYILVIFGVIVLRHFFGVLVFDALVVLFAVFGSFEISRALGDRTDRVQKIVTGVFSTLLIVCYAVSDYLYKRSQESDPSIVNYAPHLTFTVFMAGIALVFGLLVLRHEKTSLESVGCSLLSLLYPSVFLLVLSGCNHMPAYSEVGIVFVFVICPFADCFAYACGMLFGKKLPAKMSPHVSPNKTVIGGIGGILGGAIGALAIFFLYYGLISNEIALTALNGIFFVALGILTAAFTEFGDLVESAIKRKIGIKDMGKLLPGHGGILDRIDSTLYASLVVCFVIVLRIMITG